MGHALQHTMMDVLTRYKRMCGYRTLVAAGNGPRRHLDAVDGDARTEERRVSRVTTSAARSLSSAFGNGNTNRADRSPVQMRREGASVDWSREKFTMDEDLSRAVREVFVRLYEEGMIYRGNRIVNWCPNDQTVLSDLEVQKDPQAGKLYYLQYPVKEQRSTCHRRDHAAGNDAGRHGRRRQSERRTLSRSGRRRLFCCRLPIVRFRSSPTSLSIRNLAPAR